MNKLHVVAALAFVLPLAAQDASAPTASTGKAVVATEKLWKIESSGLGG